MTLNILCSPYADHCVQVLFLVTQCQSYLYYLLGLTHLTGPKRASLPVRKLTIRMPGTRQWSSIRTRHRSDAFRPRQTRSPALRCLHGETEVYLLDLVQLRPPAFRSLGLRIRRSSKSASGNETRIYAAKAIVLPANSF